MFSKTKYNLVYFTWLALGPTTWSHVAAAAAFTLGQTYLPLAHCSPDIEEFIDYMNPVDGAVSQEDLSSKIAEISQEVIEHEHNLSDPDVTGYKRHVSLIKLGNLYLQKHALIQEQRHQISDRLSRCSKKDAVPKPPYYGNAPELRSALSTFRRAISEFPDLAGTDAASYGVITSSVRAMNDNAPTLYQLFQNRYPKSTWIPLTHLAMGDYFYHRRDWPSAFAALSKAAQSSNRVAKPYALYKIAWLRMITLRGSLAEQQVEVQRSISEMQQAVTFLGQQKPRMSRYNLAKALLADLAFIWAEQNDIEQAANYFQTVGATASLKIYLNRLATRLVAAQDLAGAAKAYLRLAHDDPNNPDNAAVYEQLLVWSYAAKDPERILDTLRDMVAQHLGDSAWRQNFEGEDQVLNASQRAVERALKRYGLTLLEDGSNTGNRALLAAAAEILAMYLGQFPTGHSAYDVRFTYAAALAKIGNHRDAVQQYLQVAKSKTDQGTHYREAWLKAMTEQQILVAVNVPKRPTDGPAEAQELPAEIRQLMQIIDDSPIFVPHESVQAAAKLQVAELMITYGQLGLAAERLGRLASEFPETTSGQLALLRLLEDYQKQSAWEEIILWCERFEATLATTQSTVLPTVSGHLRRAMLERIKSTLTKAEYKNAAKLSKAFNTRFPSDSEEETVTYNAVVALLKAGLYLDATQYATQFMAKKTNAASRANLQLLIADANAQIFNFAEAVSWYQQFVNSFPSDARVPTALYNSAVAARAAGNHQQASLMFATFARNFSHDPRADLALMESGRQLQPTTISNQSRQNYSDILQPDRGGERLIAAKPPTLSPVDLENRKNYWQTLKRMSQRHKSRDQNGAFARSLAASMFNLVYEESLPFLGRLATNVEKFSVDIRTKSNAIKGIATALEDVRGAGDTEFSIASHILEARLNESLAAGLFAAPEVASKSRDNANTKDTWEQEALVAQEKAARSYTAAAKLAESTANMSPWARFARQKVASGAKGGEFRELYAPPLFLAYRSATDTGGAQGILYRLDREVRPDRLVGIAIREQKQAIDTLRTLPNDTNAKLQKSLSEIALGQAQKSIPDLMRVLGSDPKNANARKILAAAHLLTGNLDAVDSILGAFSAKSPADSDALTLQGVAATLRADYGVARGFFEAAIATNPSDAAAYLNLGLLYLEFRQFDQAEAALNRALALAKGDGTPALHLAIVKSIEGDLPAASALLDKAKELGTDTEILAFNRAAVALKVKEFDLALEYLSRYKSLTKTSPLKQQRADILRSAIETERAIYESHH
ncbi:MAG: tetratricopeptide repeat protein [Deltaproteobacteria bacterium]|nr:tetratricopeptide repeat protein [Deltaproteobacteria bacterium]